MITKTLGDILAQANALQLMQERICNYGGGKYPTRNHDRRAHRTEITFEGVDLVVEYFTDGEYMAATETDPAEYPCCLVQAVSVGGHDITRIVNVDEIASRIEQGWRTLACGRAA